MKRILKKITPFPGRIIVTMSVVLLLAEFLIMLVKDELIKPLLPGLPDMFWDFADAVTLGILVIPSLYVLVFRPLQDQQALLAQQNQKLKRLAATIQAEETELQAQHRRALETRERMIQIEKLSTVGTMVGGVAHEINNPLMGILNYVEYAQEKATDSKSREALTAALNEIGRIQKLVSNMLIFLRADNGENETCNVQDTVDRTVGLLDGEFKKGGIQVTVEVNDDLPPLSCGAGSLQQVLVNLILNSRDAVAGQPEPHIWLTARQDEGKVMLRVCDNGPGIPDGIINRIFDPFFTTKPVGQGTGLGLSISRHLVEQAGGTLQPYKENGYGCCFRLVFAVAKMDELEQRGQQNGQ